MDIATQITQANQHLHRVKIRQRKRNLFLRATLSPKPGDGDQPKQYELRTMCNATSEGLKVARAKAMELESLIIREKFDWKSYLGSQGGEEEQVKNWLKRFEKAHWQVNLKTPTKENSFHKGYRTHILRLSQDEILSPELLRDAVLEFSKPGSRNRQALCLAYRKLGEFAGLDVEFLKNLGKGYNRRAVNPRDLPSDEEIEAVRNYFFKGTDWVWVFDIMAVYGLRNHEVFLVSTNRLKEDPPVLVVPPETKTGERIVYPCASECWKEIDSSRVMLPRSVNLQGLNNNDIGEKITQKFNALGVPFGAYTLRHCYARRSFEQGFPADFSATSMGHSLKVHMETYRAWFDERTYTQVYKRVVSQRNAAQEESP